MTEPPRVIGGDQEAGEVGEPDEVGKPDEVDEVGEVGGEVREVAVVDASNVAHAEQGSGAQLVNIRVVCAKLDEEGLRPLVFADASLRHAIDDPDGYEELVKDGLIRQVPAGTDADYFILSFAREFGGRVVSNDRFRQRASAFPDVLERVIRFMIVDGEVVLDRRGKRRPD